MTAAVAIRHVAFEDLGLLEGLLTQRSASFRYLEAGLDEISPAVLARFDVLIVLGGPIGVYEASTYPFLTEEIHAIESWLHAGKPILGVCLGAQLIAHALGMRVYAHRAKEIGFGTIGLTPAGRASPLQALAAADHNVLHWHGDTFELPRQAELLAFSDITPHQAFRIGARVLGLQFHIETEISKLERWLIGHANELAAARIDVGQLRADGRRLSGSIERAGRAALGEWLDGALQDREVVR